MKHHRKIKRASKTKRVSKAKRVRKTRKTRKTRISKYTAVIPNTLKASKNVTSKIIKSSYSFLNSAKHSLKRLSKGVDKQVAKTIRSITKR
jgi:hypothetical protein